MADQCIVCLENLDVQPTAVAPELQQSAGNSDLHPSDQTAAPVVEPSAAVPPPPPTQQQQQPRSAADAAGTAAGDDDSRVAEIDICGHVLHDCCLREWTGKANSCPICRQSFNLVNVYDRVGGTKLSSYTVADKKQVAEFDAQAWLDENPEEEEPSRPCVLCQNSNHEELTLLCDGCDAPYHTYCVGLDGVPRGHWLCMECNAQYRALLGEELEDADEDEYDHGRSDYLPRTQATMRRARRRARSDEWSGAWGQIASHIFDALDLDLDNHDDDETLHNYRRAQHRRDRERREYERWQQRLSIASRLGAGDAFANNLVRGLPHRPQQRQPPPPPPQERTEVKQAWDALEKAMEASANSTNNNTNNGNGSSSSNQSNGTSSSHRKRKSRSASESPLEPPQEPERKLKRPRTRRVPQAVEASSSRRNNNSGNGESYSAASTAAAATAADTAPAATTPPAAGQGAPGAASSSAAGAPSFLSSLLKEVEASTPSDDENVRNIVGALARPPVDASSPAASPSPSGPNSPRALSATPPPRGLGDRPGSPLSLSSYVEPIYANYSRNRGRGGGDQSGSDSESTGRPRRRVQNGLMQQPSIRHPQPRHQTPVKLNVEAANRDRHSPESSPTRDALPLQTKESISAIIKAALKPHYRSGHITADQYTTINRDLSRRLYREVPEEVLSEETRRHCEKMASAEVAKAISDLREIKI